MGWRDDEDSEDVEVEEVGEDEEGEEVWEGEENEEGEEEEEADRYRVMMRFCRLCMEKMLWSFNIKFHIFVKLFCLVNGKITSFYSQGITGGQ